LMPQKRNPYALVVLRGGAGTLIGRATGVLVTQRTPSGRTDNLLYAYGEVAGAVDLAARLLRLAAAVAESLTFDAERAERVLRESGAMATDVAEAISLATGIDYRSAYREVAQDLDAAARSVPDGLEPAAAIATRTVAGGAAPEPLDSMLAACRDAIARARSWVERERRAVEDAERRLVELARK
jgi:argininosuccinate lyase